MKATGRHLLVEYHDCDREVLNDLHKIEELMKAAAQAAEARVVGTVFHPFSPQGVTGVIVIEESHLSIHTWPEYGYAAVDFFTCGECLPERAHEVLKNGLSAANSEKMLIKRGLLPGPPSLEIVDHQTENAEDSQVLTSGPDSIASAGGIPLTCSARR
ncbi:MAG: adenosylmethionine decarboxylase [Proteobacteria bacterium]|nr:adenosylmethionine decarboxylase [Pseudomonadota bacterium]